ncbi:hypothetical protein IFM12275_06610 [Nocardia sputorum]|uniref:Uncharacterized protein n=1 Tax=Nocardia sputorum TaxID=2984338 RepID=A0ABN6U278_9NOCA|nr:hypothetical protein IFM12275_06610 [Nocardia sputorum]BDT99318.1 hypothetical protein IFM12276_23470 [Nocardia sputorum]
MSQGEFGGQAVAHRVLATLDQLLKPTKDRFRGADAVHPAFFDCHVTKYGDPPIERQNASSSTFRAEIEIDRAM